MVHLVGSVGRGGVNRYEDVSLVQRLVNAKLPVPLASLVVDGLCGPKTILAIEEYQRRVVGLIRTDGRVDRDGATFRSLKASAVSPATPTSPSIRPAHAVEVLQRYGFVRPNEIVAAAARARLPIAQAAVLLVKESNGGRNVWGHDKEHTGGAYEKGGQVTEQNYRAYVAAVAAGTAGRQGVGPTQLTWGGYQKEADRRGGCWRWEINVAYGFEILAGLIRTNGVQGGYTAYNGAVAYGIDAVKRLRVWEPRFSGR